MASVATDIVMGVGDVSNPGVFIIYGLPGLDKQLLVDLIEQDGVADSELTDVALDSFGYHDVEGLLNLGVTKGPAQEKQS